AKACRHDRLRQQIGRRWWQRPSRGRDSASLVQYQQGSCSDPISIVRLKPDATEGARSRTLPKGACSVRLQPDVAPADVGQACNADRSREATNDSPSSPAGIIGENERNAWIVLGKQRYSTATPAAESASA